jgi:hypothetical protein
MSAPKRRHSTVVVEVGERKEEIDELIAPLIEALWIADIATVMSCEETEPGIAWIEFEEVDDLICFLNIVSVFEAGADSLYNRISGRLVSPKNSLPIWEYQLNLLDCAVDGDDNHVVGTRSAFLSSVDCISLMRICPRF